MTSPRHRHQPRPGLLWPPVQTVDVIIPALNEEETIAGCIASVLPQPGIARILVADGGSSDATVSIAQQYSNVTVVLAPRGRGLQIREALTHATAGIVCTLHADSRLRPNSARRILEALNRHQRCAGGALGARYDDPALRFRITEGINNLRARLLGVSFGDQAQFFRRAAIGNDFPGLLLMEDVELSLLMRARGGCCFVPNGVFSSTRRWRHHGYLRNFTKVVFLTSLYIIKRRLGSVTPDAHEFYRAYYG